MTEPDQPRIVVTGGAGFIGSALIHALNQQGHRNILVVDRLDDSPKWRNLRPLVYEDYLDADEWIDRVRRDQAGGEAGELCFHLGACSSTTEMDMDFLMGNNTRYTSDLAVWALRRGVRFVYASSAATYGDGGQGMDDQDDDLGKLAPLNPYGYSKHLFDCQAQARGWLDHIVGLKYFNVFGPNEDHKGEMRSLVHKAFHQVRSEGTISLFRSHRPDYRDGEQCRDFLYIKDAVAMTLHLAFHPQATGLFNLGSGKARTWIDLAKAVFGACDREPRIEFIDMPEGLRDCYQYFTEAPVQKLLATGWEDIRFPLEEAVADYIRHYLIPDRRLGES